MLIRVGSYLLRLVEIILVSGSKIKVDRTTQHRSGVVCVLRSARSADVDMLAVCHTVHLLILYLSYNAAAHVVEASRVTVVEMFLLPCVHLLGIVEVVLILVHCLGRTCVVLVHIIICRCLVRAFVKLRHPHQRRDYR